MNAKMLRKFFYWVNERHAIYLKKERGELWPWTKDPILVKYKFTNVFRQLDRTTKDLCARLQELRTSNKILVFSNIVIFRLFNRTETYDELFRNGLCEEWNCRYATKILENYKKRGNKVFTGAYMVTGGSLNGKGRSKISMICEAIDDILRDTDTLLKNKTIQDMVGALREYNTVGGFVAYELATDMRHTTILHNAPDIMTWANPGPGARRGLNRIHDRPLPSRVSEEQMVQEMRIILDHSMRKRKSHVPQLEMRDIEHSLCEFDKYMRVFNKEGRTPRGIYKRRAL